MEAAAWFGGLITWRSEVIARVHLTGPSLCSKMLYGWSSATIHHFLVRRDARFTREPTATELSAPGEREMWGAPPHAPQQPVAAPPLFVLQCGNVAVLVDVHVVLPLGAPEEDTSWFTAEHVEEVTVLVQDAVEQRVKQHAESLHSRGQAKHKKELAPATAFSATGTSVAPQRRPHHNPCAPGPLKGLKPGIGRGGGELCSACKVVGGVYAGASVGSQGLPPVPGPKNHPRARARVPSLALPYTGGRALGGGNTCQPVPPWPWQAAQAFSQAPQMNGH
ncbi:Protein SLX4IP [Merluccius polli]|uniref:Protein SLX4IP n=1 Tax=Merluccius polli TaxID=89951 RepID=A0AA47P9B6_MERPO|nr:Protein SLX4IP [Merluccius polli]